MRCMTKSTFANKHNTLTVTDTRLDFYSRRQIGILFFFSFCTISYFDMLFYVLTFLPFIFYYFYDFDFPFRFHIHMTHTDRHSRACNGKNVRKTPNFITKCSHVDCSVFLFSDFWTAKCRERIPTKKQNEMK